MILAAQQAPPPPSVRLCIGVTGHRESHPLYAANLARIEATLRGLLDLIGAAIAETAPPFNAPFAPLRLHSLLAGGADQLAAREALARGWDVVAPLPFGAALNRAINAQPQSAADARALLAGGAPTDQATARRADAITALAQQAHLFELADDDADMQAAFLATLDAPNDIAVADAYKADCSERVALAARVVIEQSDFLIAIWDGARTSLVGGTGHTIAAALDLGASVIWIDPAAPESWRVLSAPEALASLRTLAPDPSRDDHVKHLVRDALLPGDPQPPHAPHGAEAAPKRDAAALRAEQWHATSNGLWHAYRRVEALFSGEPGCNPWRALRQTYDTPEAFATGAGAATLAVSTALPNIDPRFSARLRAGVMDRFAWTDAISSYLSDAYRGGMILNFCLSALAIIGGVAYLPLTGGAVKWPFAAFELVLLSAILAITFFGQARGWHGRWFETRRVAEYLRHAPLLLAVGAARAPGQWPRGAETSWPEHYARHALREIGLPRVAVTPAYLRQVLTGLLTPHVTAQLEYHRAKAKRLASVHHNLDRLSERMFQAAVVAVLIYLAVALAAAFELGDHKFVANAGKIFTFLGVALPTLGGAIAGIRYFGDFERFAAISEITAGKLAAVRDRITLLLNAPDAAMDYGSVAELARAADMIVVSEIESWQAVFAGKHITVPV
jgi:hypothetical protein